MGKNLGLKGFLQALISERLTKRELRLMRRVGVDVYEKKKMKVSL